MSEKKYRLRVSTGGNHMLEPVPLADSVVPLANSVFGVADEVAALLKTHPDVEDRTQPDYSDVPVGTAGTATVRGVKGVRVMRDAPEGDGDKYLWHSTEEVPIGDDEGSWAHRDRDVTDFVPDVVVDEDLIERVDSIYEGQFCVHHDRVVALLRGETS